MSNFSFSYQTTSVLLSTSDLASLASDATLLAGRASAAVDNRTTKYQDAQVGGYVRSSGSGLGMVFGRWQLWAGGILDDGGSPVYPDAFDGTNKAVTLSNLEIKHACLRLLGGSNMNASAVAKDYWLPPVSLRRRFGVMPKIWWVWLTQHTGTTLNTSVGGQIVYNNTLFTG